MFYIMKNGIIDTVADAPIGENSIETDREIIYSYKVEHFVFADEVNMQEEEQAKAEYFAKIEAEDKAYQEQPTVADLVEAISILTDYVFGESEVADNG